MPALAESIHRWMLHKQQTMHRRRRLVAGFPRFGFGQDIFFQQRLLVIPGLLVAHPAQIFKDDCLHAVQNYANGPKVVPLRKCLKCTVTRNRTENWTKARLPTVQKSFTSA